jgi:predicted transposase YdaD
MGREEIEAMFGLSELEQTKVYQEAFEEGEERQSLKTAKAVAVLFKVGLTSEQIAQELSMTVEEVQQLMQKLPKD